MNSNERLNDYDLVNEGWDKVASQMHKKAFSGSDEVAAREWIDEITFNGNMRRANQINKNRYKRVGRYKKKISAPVEAGEALFLTLTFRDDVMSGTTEAVRRRYVRRWLKKVAPRLYVANIDYGGETGREHYHAVVEASREVIEANKWPYGYSKAERCATSDTDKTRLSKYIVKLTAHAFKKTAKRQYCIYSRTAK